MNGLSEIQQSTTWYEFADPAIIYYSDEWEYHNWKHACHVAVVANSFASQCIDKEMHLDRDVLLVAAAWHDAGYHEDHTALGFSTKEQYSSALATDYLQAEGATPEFVAEVQEAILATTHKAARDSLVSLVLHRADINDLGSSYTTFARNNCLLLLEARRTNPGLTFGEWQANVGTFLEFIIAEALVELPRLEFQTGATHTFDNKVKQNRERFMKIKDERAFKDKHGIAA